MEFDLLKKHISEVLGVDPSEITRDSAFEEDLGADSLDLFVVIMSIEKELEMEVDVEALKGIRTVGEAEELIKKTVGSK